MNDDRSLIDRTSKLPIDIVLEGENGVGKDTTAKNIHRISGRSGRFVHVNCAAIPETLMESEFFGVEAGAYTGATKTRPGKIENADEGTLYLDEIDSIPLTLQAKLLTSLQERGCERLGASHFIKSNFRVIASTKTKLSELVQQGRFRSDLYYRINVVVIRLLSLRDRPEEILSLFKIFCDEYAKLYDLDIPEINQSIEDTLLAHDWPGNVRELKSAACRFVIRLPLLDHAPDNLESGSKSIKSRLQNIEKAIVVMTLNKHNGSLKNASAELGLPLTTFSYRLKILEINY